MFTNVNVMGYRLCGLKRFGFHRIRWSEKCVRNCVCVFFRWNYRWFPVGGWYMKCNNLCLPGADADTGGGTISMQMWTFPSFFPSLRGTINLTIVDSITSNHVLLNMYTDFFFRARFTREWNEFKLLLYRFPQMRSIFEIMGSKRSYIEIIFNFHFFLHPLIFCETAYLRQSKMFKFFSIEIFLQFFCCFRVQQTNESFGTMKSISIR